MTFFDASDTAEFTSLMREASADSAEIMRDVPPVVSDGHGGRIPNMQTVSTVAAFVRQAGDSHIENDVAGYEQSVSLAIISVPIGTNVTTHDRVRINGTDTYEVVGIVPIRTFAVRKRLIARIIS